MQTASRPLRIASYNIHRAIGSDRRRDPARIAAVIDELRADVVGLQEVDWHIDENLHEPQSEYLAHLPGYQAVAGPNISDHRGHYGNLLLTRLPIRRVRQIDLSEPRREARGAIDVDLDVYGKNVRVIVTHFGLAIRERRRQALRLRSLILERPRQATLLLGDFNDWVPGSMTLRPLIDLCSTMSRSKSWPAFCPFLALDRIMSIGCPSPVVIHAHVSPLGRIASDHYPVIAEFERGAVSAAVPSNGDSGV